MKRLISLLLVLIIIVFATGCGSEKTIKTEESTVKIQDEQVEVVSEDGKSQTTIGEAGEVSLPDGYPKDLVPIIDGGKVAASTRNEDENKHVTYSVMLFTEKDIKEVTNYYKESLKGLKEFQIMETPETTTIGGQNEDYTIFVFAGVDNSEDTPRTGVNITLTPILE